MAPPAPAKGPDASRLLAEAARKERAVQAEKASWKAQRTKEEGEWKERIAKAERFEAAKANAKKAPLAALAELELTYEELSTAQLQDGKPGADLAIREANEKIAALEKSIAADKEKAKADAEQAQKDAGKAAVAKFHENVSRSVVAAGDKYELVNALGYQGEVGKMIEEHYDATGVEKSWTEAADALEAHLQAEQEPAVAEVFKKLAGTKWFKSRYAPVAQATQAPAAPRRSRDTEVPEKKVEAPAPTITNKMTASHKPSNAAGKTRAELRAQAEKLLGG